MLKNIIIAILFTFLISSCKQQLKNTSSSVNGIWESVASGWILQIKDSSDYNFYDITSISCLPSRKGNLKELEKSLILKNDTLNLLKGVITYNPLRRIS